MADLYTRILELCSAKGIKAGKMCADIGISRGMLTDLKMGRKQTYSSATLQKIADYFGVTVDYLLSRGENDTISDELLIPGLLDGDAEGFTPEMLDEVKRFAKYIQHRGSL